MTFPKIIAQLKDETYLCQMTHKHASIAIKNGSRCVSPPFHNYMRPYLFKVMCGSTHAELATINYLLNTMCRGEVRKNPQLIKQPYTWKSAL